MVGYPEGAAVVAIVGDAWFAVDEVRGGIVELDVLPDGE